jgi:hypothetical protein
MYSPIPNKTYSFSLEAEYYTLHNYSRHYEPQSDMSTTKNHKYLSALEALSSSLLFCPLRLFQHADDIIPGMPVETCL